VQVHRLDGISAPTRLPGSFKAERGRFERQARACHRALQAALARVESVECGFLASSLDLSDAVVFATGKRVGYRPNNSQPTRCVNEMLMCSVATRPTLVGDG
jgi:hypothetical protein